MGNVSRRLEESRRQRILSNIMKKLSCTFRFKLKQGNGREYQEEGKVSYNSENGLIKRQRFPTWDKCLSQVSSEPHRFSLFNFELFKKEKR